MFADELRTMVAVGAVTPSSVRIWARSDRTGPHRLVIEAAGATARVADVDVPEGPRDNTAAWTYPDELGGSALAADTPHTFRVERPDGTLVGDGRFRTAPVERASFCFAVVSCHQPFDTDGTVLEGSRAMLRAFHAALVEREARFVLMVGDQIYADFPPSLSMFHDKSCDVLACSRDEVRARYQQRYRFAWAMPELQRIYADFASWPILDDHEIVNNAGSVHEHATPKWAALRAGALDAFADYQASRVIRAPVSSFDHGFRFAGVAVYQLDIRSHRYLQGHHMQILGPEQLESFRGFVAAHAEARVLAVTIPVPIAYVPGWFAALADLVTPDHDGADRWSYPPAKPDRDALLGVLLDQARAHPEQRIVLVSGDVHVGTVFELRWDHGPVFHQLTASALTNDVGPLARKIYSLVPHLERALHCGDHRARVVPVAGDDNPFGGLNAGFVHVDDDGTRARIRFELVTSSDGDPSVPRVAYASPWL